MRTRLLALSSCLFVLGCGPGPRKVGTAPSWRRVEAASPELAASSGVRRTEPITFAPTSTAATRYNDPPSSPAPSSPVGDAITLAVQRAALDLGITAPIADGRLFAAAQDMAAAVPTEGVVPYPLVEFALQHHGIIEPSPHLLVIWGPIDDPAAIVEQLEPRLPDLLAAGPLRLGVGTATRAGDEDVVVVALQASGVKTRPIVRALPDGGVIRIEGEVLPPFTGPDVFVTGNDGVVSRVRSTAGASKTAFKAEVDCARRVGRQQIEITAVDSSGSTVLANFPVWCGEVAPLQITVAPSLDDESPVTSEAEAELRMLGLVNADRAANGLPALALDEQVADVARAHSAEMHATGNVAHVSATTGSAADRVRSAGIRTAAVLENIARAYGVSEAEAGLMNSPGHRANLLSAAVTHVGIGIVFGEQVAGRREMFVTQVFTRVTPKVDPARVAVTLRAALGEVRTLGDDQALDRVAGAYADDLAKGIPSKEASARASKALEGMATRYRRIGSVITTVSDLAALDAASLIEGAVASHVGIGIAQGSHADLGEGAIYVVLLLAVER